MSTFCWRCVICASTWETDSPSTPPEHDCKAGSTTFTYQDGSTETFKSSPVIRDYKRESVAIDKRFFRTGPR